MVWVIWNQKFGRNRSSTLPPFPGSTRDPFWLVVSTHLKNISQNGNLPQLRVKIKNIWNHHLALFVVWVLSFQRLAKDSFLIGNFHQILDLLSSERGLKQITFSKMAETIHPWKSTWNHQKMVVCRCFSFSKKVLSGSMWVSGGVWLRIYWSLSPLSFVEAKFWEIYILR